MEPKKNIKKHKLVEPQWGWTIPQEELGTRLDEISYMNTTRSPANWIIMGSYTAELFNRAIQGYENLPEIEMGDFRVEGDSYIQDITIRPTREEVITVDFNILPSGGEFYSGGTQQNTSVSFITGATGTW